MRSALLGPVLLALALRLVAVVATDRVVAFIRRIAARAFVTRVKELRVVVTEYCG